MQVDPWSFGDDGGNAWRTKSTTFRRWWEGTRGNLLGYSRVNWKARREARTWHKVRDELIGVVASTLYQ